VTDRGLVDGNAPQASEDCICLDNQPHKIIMKTFLLELETYLKISEETLHPSILKHEKMAYLISRCRLLQVCARFIQKTSVTKDYEIQSEQNF
jgi:hypothetical protein